MTNFLSGTFPLIGSVAISGFALLSAGCSTGGAKSVAELEVFDTLDTFRRGELRLTCGTACSGSWGSARRTAKSYLENSLWSDLAVEVARVGHRVDLAYFYLGRAAEGLGHVDAARTYYRLAIANRYKCAGMINNCDGFDVPYETKAGLERLPVGTLPQDISTPVPANSLSPTTDNKPSTNEAISEPSNIEAQGSVKERQKAEILEKSRLQREEEKALEQEKARKKKEALEAATLRREEAKAREEEKVRQKAAARQEAMALEKTTRKAFLSPTPDQRSKIVSAIKESMFDPYSAVFEEISVLDNKFACGSVNGKNRFGGYVGKKQALVSNLQGLWVLIQIEEMSHANCKLIVKQMVEKY